ncbi:hypothetical protein ABIF13_000601 [Bradyrhizobium elkanii]
MTDHDDIEPAQAASPTDHVLSELQLFGYRPFDDQPDPRPLPEAKTIAGAIVDMFDALVATLSDTRLEPDLDELLWSTVNLFHRAVDRIERQLDDNEQAQHKSQREQNGSEVRSVELERLMAEGITLIERRNCLEIFRDQAIERFEVHTGSSWRPRSGSLVNHRTLTAAMIDSRDFIAAKRRTESEDMLPPGVKIALTGGLDFNDHRLIWDRLDKVRAKHPDMVLLHGGSPKGAELIASKWATTRKVPQIVFKPDWTKHAKAAPFKRNDAMLELLPIGVTHALSGYRDPGQPRRQGEAFRHPRLEIRRRVSAVVSPPNHQSGVVRAATPPRSDLISEVAPWWWWKARLANPCNWSRHHARPWACSQRTRHRFVLLGGFRAGSVCLAVFRRT